MKLEDKSGKFEDELGKCVELFEKTFNSKVQRAKDIARYIAVGGKKMRAMLVLGVGHFCNTNPTASRILATVVESMHMATLLHDDVIDGSVRRRHRQTAHHVWDIQSSILGGDFLLAGIFQMLLDVGDLPILKAFADTAKSMAEAELLQMDHKDQCSMDPDVCLAVMEGKTASLFAFATQCCSLHPSSENRSQAEALRAYGYHLGMAFQMVDDVLDYQSSPEIMGKNPFEDWLSGSITLPVAMAYHHGSSTQKQTLKSLIQERAQQNNHDQNYQNNHTLHAQITNLLDATGALESVRKTIQGHGKQAREALREAHAIAPPKDAHAYTFLKNCLEKVLTRKH